MAEAVLIRLLLDIEGASDDEKSMGLDAAEAVFTVAETDPYEAAWACNARDDQNEGGEKMTAKEASICHVWDEADKAAIEACCAGWSLKPASEILKFEEIARVGLPMAAMTGSAQTAR
jgi:hypothetical protein